MLVLSRHRDERIMIGDDIVLTIVDICGDKVRIGIEAPADVPVHRQEVYEAIHRQGRYGREAEDLGGICAEGRGKFLGRTIDGG